MIRLSVGLPAYRSTIHVGHAGMWLALGAAAATAKDIEIVGFQAIDVCGVGKARNALVREALQDAADWLLMVDSDNFLVPSERVPDIGDAILRMVRDAATASAAAIAAPSFARTRRVPNFKAARSPDGEVFLAERVGGGMLAVNLGWLREHWPEPPWFAPKYLPGPDLPVLGEDWTFCETVIARGGQILCDGRIWLAHADTTVTGAE